MFLGSVVVIHNYVLHGIMLSAKTLPELPVVCIAFAMWGF